MLQEFHAMTVPLSIDDRVPARAAVQTSPDLLRQMLTMFINTLNSADANAVCGGA